MPVMLDGFDFLKDFLLIVIGVLVVFAVCRVSVQIGYWFLFSKVIFFSGLAAAGCGVLGIVLNIKTAVHRARVFADIDNKKEVSDGKSFKALD